ncbi:hypothetical protein Bbelb_043190 [Branchiostoma belcheri]|nr:hypothetical protein Bbelb_043190 [Branchiostoma belcheri]
MHEHTISSHNVLQSRCRLTPSNSATITLRVSRQQIVHYLVIHKRNNSSYRLALYPAPLICPTMFTEAPVGERLVNRSPRATNAAAHPSYSRSGYCGVVRFSAHGPANHL